MRLLLKKAHHVPEPPAPIPRSYIKAYSDFRTRMSVALHNHVGSVWSRYLKDCEPLLAPLGGELVPVPAHAPVPPPHPVQVEAVQAADVQVQPLGQNAADLALVPADNNAALA